MRRCEGPKWISLEPHGRMPVSALRSPQIPPAPGNSHPATTYCRFRTVRLHLLHRRPLSLTPQGSWTSGHVVLVGDAAHVAPPSGQGINVAFEDAAALAAAVRQHGLGPKVRAAE